MQVLHLLLMGIYFRHLHGFEYQDEPYNDTAKHTNWTSKTVDATYYSAPAGCS